MTAAIEAAPSGLTPVHVITRGLDIASTPAEAKALADRVAGIVRWASRANADIPAINQLKTIQLRCQRKAGRLLAAIAREEAGRPIGNSSRAETNLQRAIRDAGLSRATAHRWQQLAQIEEDVFSEYVALQTRDGVEITVSGLLAYAFPNVDDGTGEGLPGARVPMGPDRQRAHERARAVRNTIKEFSPTPHEHFYAALHLLLSRSERAVLRSACDIVATRVGTADKPVAATIYQGMTQLARHVLVSMSVTERDALRERVPIDVRRFFGLG